MAKCTTFLVHDTVERFFQTAFKDIVDAEFLLALRDHSPLFSAATPAVSPVRQRTADLMIVPITTAGAEDDEGVNNPEELDDNFPLVAIEVGFSEMHKGHGEMARV